MAAYNKINQFVQDLATKKHDLSADVMTIGLTTTANKPVATNTILGNLTVIAYTNLSARVPTFTSCAQTAGTLKYIVADLVLTASGPVAAFGAIVLYNDTQTVPAKPLVAWWEYGSDVTMANTETFTLDFDNVNGILELV